MGNKNYNRQMVSWNCKHAQHVKIYLPCNFEVNLITHLGVIALFSSIFFILILFVLEHVCSFNLPSVCYSFWNKGRKVLKFWKFTEKREITPNPFKIVSVSAVLYPRWPPLLKIEISSNDQNCSILSQKVPKFELYKHNDKLFNLYSQGSFQQSLVEIGSVVSEEKIFKKLHPPFFLICIIGQNRQKFKVHKKSRNIC
jgi:hypothetical protein